MSWLKLPRSARVKDASLNRPRARSTPRKTASVVLPQRINTALARQRRLHVNTHQLFFSKTTDSRRVVQILLIVDI
jgi:hypothetical protein